MRHCIAIKSSITEMEIFGICHSSFHICTLCIWVLDMSGSDTVTNVNHQNIKINFQL